MHQSKQQALARAIRPQDDRDASILQLKVNAVDQPPATSLKGEKLKRQ
jgi:hypothetical protein